MHSTNRVIENQKDAVDRDSLYVVRQMHKRRLTAEASCACREGEPRVQFAIVPNSLLAKNTSKTL